MMLFGGLDVENTSAVDGIIAFTNTSYPRLVFLSLKKDDDAYAQALKLQLEKGIAG